MLKIGGMGLIVCSLLLMIVCHQSLCCKLLVHYALALDVKKMKAAVFLADNIAGHYSRTSASAQRFTHTLQVADSIMSETQMDSVWATMSSADKPIGITDETTVQYEALTTEIDESFNAWRQSPWKKEVDFTTFCNYILPYRVMNETYKVGWKSFLFKKYHSLVKNIDDLKTAFFVVHDSISRQVKRSAHQYPYQLNPFEMEWVMKGNCLQRCMYEVAVMRALGIPAVIDGIDFWGNYSKNGHTWVALVTRDGTYTVAQDDTVARKYNPIDASIFTLKQSVPKDYPYSTSFSKRCAKIYRHQYAMVRTECQDVDAPRDVRMHFGNGFSLDVSESYGLKSQITIRDSIHAYAYLCTYRTGNGWQPVTFVKSEQGTFCFKNLGDSVVYLPICYDKGKAMPLSNPLLVTKGKIRELIPDYSQLHTISLSRKYPLVANFINYWNTLVGGKVEGAVYRDFRDSTLLYEIKATPTYLNLLRANCNRKFRYIRFCAPTKCNTPLAEVSFCIRGRWGKADVSSEESEEIEKCVDGDEFTMPKRVHSGYRLYFDFLRPTRVDSISFIARNDGNFVQPGKIYALKYYDKGWHVLSERKSQGHRVVFNDVPRGALLMLEELEGGDESRPFLYEQGCQQWY